MVQWIDKIYVLEVKQSSPNESALKLSGKQWQKKIFYQKIYLKWGVEKINPVKDFDNKLKNYGGLRSTL